MNWVTSMEEAKASVRESIEYTIYILETIDGVSATGGHFNVCFDSNNDFVVMYG